MKSKELFKTYNIQNLKQNKWTMLFISLSILITMTVSLIIPQIQISKQAFISETIERASPADLVVVQSFPSDAFETKMEEYEQLGLEVQRIGTSPIYLEDNNNKIMIYLLTGYEEMFENEIVISQSLANKYNLRVGDKPNLYGITTDDMDVTISEIEVLPTDVFNDAEIFGYIKTKNLETPFDSGTNIIFISGKEGDVLKSELSDIESGFKYSTKVDRKEAMFNHLDKQIMALNLIATVGYILAMAVLLSGIIMLIVKRQKEIASLMLIPIKVKDIIKSLKWEINIIILIPLILAIILSIPLTKYILHVEGISPAYSSTYVITLIKFAAFNMLVFMICRNMGLQVLNRIDPVQIVNGGNGFPRKNKLRVIGFIVLLFIILSLYSILLGSGESMVSNYMLFVALFVLGIALLILVVAISKIPIWKRFTSTLYAFHSIRKHKLIFIISILNVTMVLWFILIGFGLGNTLKESVDEGYQDSLPYNYLIRTDEPAKLENTLKDSIYIDKFTKFNYTDAKLGDENIQNNQVRINEVSRNSSALSFDIIKGQGVFDGELNEILISKNYADAYQLNIGNYLKVITSYGDFEYRIKGIYDSVGINNNWILKADEKIFNDTIYLIKAEDDSFLGEIENSYIANTNVIGDYLLAQMDSFLISFKYICLLFILASVIFNINLQYLSQDIDKREHAIIRSIGIGDGLVKKQSFIKGFVSFICSVSMSLLLFTIIISLAVSSISSGKIKVNSKIYVLVIILSAFFIFIGNLVVHFNKYNDTEVIRE